MLVILHRFITAEQLCAFIALLLLNNYAPGLCNRSGAASQNCTTIATEHQKSFAAMKAAMRAIATHQEAIRILDLDMATLSKDAAVKSGKQREFFLFSPRIATHEENRYFEKQEGADGMG